MGTSASAWPRSIRSHARARTRPSRQSATEQAESEVSKASTSMVEGPYRHGAGTSSRPAAGARRGPDAGMSGRPDARAMVRGRAHGKTSAVRPERRIDMTLVPIANPDYDVAFDIVYATSRNFTGNPVYSRAACYLHADAAAALRRAIDLAAGIGLRLKIFDAFRPAEAQWVLWNHTPNPDFLADPRRGSPHSRGVAVDLTLVDPQGHELDMGTGFDEFSPRSHHAAEGLAVEVQRNRFVLLGLMTAAAWTFSRNEWCSNPLFASRAFSSSVSFSSNTPSMPLAPSLAGTPA